MNKKEMQDIIYTALCEEAVSSFSNPSDRTINWTQQAARIADKLVSHSEKSEHQLRVEKFMNLAKQELPIRPSMPSVKIRLLRSKLILEESLETIKALGFGFKEKEFDQVPLEHTLINELEEKFEPNFIEIIDGLCDISVVTIGTAIACGISLEPILELVDENNLAKFGPGHSIREDGKLVKPPNHKKPDIKSEIERQIENKEHSLFNSKK